MIRAKHLRVLSQLFELAYDRDLYREFPIVKYEGLKYMNLNLITFAYLHENEAPVRLRIKEIFAAKIYMKGVCTPANLQQILR